MLSSRLYGTYIYITPRFYNGSTSPALILDSNVN
jgi:hypothetical protein